MQLSRFRVAMIVILSLVIGWMANDYMTPAQKKRPVLNFIRNWWWVPLILDEPKAEDTSCHEGKEIGPDGYRLVHHGRAL